MPTRAHAKTCRKIYLYGLEQSGRGDRVRSSDTQSSSGAISGGVDFAVRRHGEQRLFSADELHRTNTGQSVAAERKLHLKEGSRMHTKVH